eukprot:UN20703
MHITSFWFFMGTLCHPKQSTFGNGAEFEGTSWFLLALLGEIGWSGYLFPELIRYFRGNFKAGSLITGFIWCILQYPGIILQSSNLIGEGCNIVAILNIKDNLNSWHLISIYTSILLALRIILNHILLKTFSHR